MKIPESTSYLTIEVISDQIEGNERVVHIRKICTGNPVEQFITDSVIRGPVVQEEKQEVKVTKPVRARNKKGHYIKDDPTTPENEAWVGGLAPNRLTKPKSPRKRRTRKSKEVNS
tara:strand:+ start:2541 stop:2885 length:345 start_codon:yes stop_codon:yes gene_type:complete